MGARETSIEAYYDAKTQGLIRQNEIVVIEVAHQNFRDEGHTTKELMHLLGKSIGRHDWDAIQDFQKVIKPLKRKGVLEEMNKRPCEITGRNAYPVRLTYNKPVKIDHEEGEKVRLRKTVADQAARIRFLETQNTELLDRIRRIEKGELF